MCFLRHILIMSAIFNLAVFLSGLLLGILREELLVVSIALTSVGLFGMVIFAIIWILRPKALARPITVIKKRHWRKSELDKEAAITPDTTEQIMKNIRGIPYLIQAIQYSMETSYYRDVMSEYGDGTMRSAHVIHTAPACTSILDSESEEEELHNNTKITPRNSAEVEWVPIGESWRNEQLRLSLERGSSSLLVFPYSESSPHRDSLNRERIESEFARIDSIKRPRKNRHLADNTFQIRCIGMSAEFIERFSDSFRAFDA